MRPTLLAPATPLAARGGRSGSGTEELRKDLADSVASASATIAEIKTLLAARDSA
jgi:hypothetical protein